MTISTIANGELGLNCRTSLNQVITLVNGLRPALSGNLTYYVNASTGNDSNDGLTPATAFATIARGTVVAATNDFNGFTVTISVADGTYTESFNLPVCVGQETPFNFLIVGDTATPANVVVNATTSFVGAITAVAGSSCEVSGMTIVPASSNGFGLSTLGGTMYLGQGIVFGGASSCWSHLAAANGGIITAFNNYTITGSGAAHMFVANIASITAQNLGITLTGTPAFSQGFIFAENCAIASVAGNTFTGGATGSRYNITGNAVVNTNGGGANYLPGNSAGTTASGGQYL